MKKFLGLFLMILSLFTLIGCGKDDKEDEGKTSFADYLAENGGISIADIDAKINQQFISDLPADVSNGVSVDNIEMLIELKEGNGSYQEQAKLYGWQDETKVYFTPYFSKDNSALDGIYVDLNELEQYYDYGKTYASQYLAEMDASEMLDMVIAELAAEYQLQSLNLDLAKVLGALTFTIDDFTEKDGVYVLNINNVVAKAEAISGGMVTVDQVNQLLAMYGLNIELAVTFDGKHVSNIKLSGSMTGEGVSMEASLDLALSYNGDELSGAKLTIASPVANGTVEVKLEENKSSIDINVVIKPIGGTESASVIVKYSMSDTEYVAYATLNDVVYVDTKLNYTLGNKISVSGYSIQYQSEYYDGNTYTTAYSKTTIKSGSSVTIPQVCKNKMPYCRNVLEMLMSEIA